MWKDALEFIPSLKAHRGQPMAAQISLLPGIAWEHPVVSEADGEQGKSPFEGSAQRHPDNLCFPNSFSMAGSILLPAFYRNLNLFSSMLRQKNPHQNKRSHPAAQFSIILCTKIIPLHTLQILHQQDPVRAPLGLNIHHIHFHNTTQTL